MARSSDTSSHHQCVTCLTMNLETLSSPGGEVNAGNNSGASCSLGSLLGLSVCRSRAEAAQSFAKKLQTKLWSLGPASLSSNGLAGNEEDPDSSWLPPSVVAVEARLDLSRGVVTTVPVKSPSSSSLVQQSVVMEKGNNDAGQQQQEDQRVIKVAQWMGSNGYGRSGANDAGAGRDQESDASSTTTNPLSDSDQYFDFGIETPLDGDSSAGEEPTTVTNSNACHVIKHDDPQLAHIVINSDDGLPAQPESGCIFGSPVLSGEESDEVEAEEASYYESLSQSPASTGFSVAKAQQQLDSVGSSVTLNCTEEDNDGHVGRDKIPTPPASPGLSELFSFGPAHARQCPRDPLATPPRDNSARGIVPTSQGGLEDVANALGGDEAQHLGLVGDQDECESHGERRSTREALVGVANENAEMVVVMKPPIASQLEHIDQLFDGSAKDGGIIDIRPSADGCSATTGAGDSDVGHVPPGSGIDVHRALLCDLESHQSSKASSDQYGDAPSGEPEAEEDGVKAETKKTTREASASPARDVENDGDVEDECDDDSTQLYRHRVQRSTSLKTGKTPPGTPGRKKIVRFADALGLDLALVRTFLDEVPNVPQSAFSDLNGVDPSSENDLSLGSSPFASGWTPGSYLPIASRANPGAAAVVGGHRTNPLRSLVASFTQPGSLPNFLELVKNQKVCLETACLVDDTKLRGVVRVLNLDFHKSVLIRYTTDEWSSSSDQMAVYVPGSCDGLSDRFSFSLPGAQTLQPGQRLIFALCYRVAGQEIWDSNQGKNYVFQCISSTSFMPSSIALQHYSHQSPTRESFVDHHDSFLPYM